MSDLIDRFPHAQNCAIYTIREQPERKVVQDDPWTDSNVPVEEVKMPWGECNCHVAEIQRLRQALAQIDEYADTFITHEEKESCGDCWVLTEIRRMAAEALKDSKS